MHSLLTTLRRWLLFFRAMFAPLGTRQDAKDAVRRIRDDLER